MIRHKIFVRALLLHFTGDGFLFTGWTFKNFLSMCLSDLKDYVTRQTFYQPMLFLQFRGAYFFIKCFFIFSFSIISQLLSSFKLLIPASRIGFLFFLRFQLNSEDVFLFFNLLEELVCLLSCTS